MTWNDATIDMKVPTCTRKDMLHVEEDLFVFSKTDRIAKLLNTKYLKILTRRFEKANKQFIPAKQQPKIIFTYIARQAT